jgi:hypothetical protein
MSHGLSYVKFSEIKPPHECKYPESISTHQPAYPCIQSPGAVLILENKCPMGLTAQAQKTHHTQRQLTSQVQ